MTAHLNKERNVSGCVEIKVNLLLGFIGNRRLMMLNTDMSLLKSINGKICSQLLVTKNQDDFNYLKLIMQTKSAF